MFGVYKQTHAELHNPTTNESFTVVPGTKIRSGNDVFTVSDILYQTGFAEAPSTTWIHTVQGIIFEIGEYDRTLPFTLY